MSLSTVASRGAASIVIGTGTAVATTLTGMHSRPVALSLMHHNLVPIKIVLVAPGSRGNASSSEHPGPAIHDVFLPTVFT